MGNPIATSFPEARVLVVDDEVSVCSALARALTLLGYHADAAHSGTEALEMLGRMPYDVAILDVWMPGMDGIEVLHWTRQAHPDLSVIMLTGRSTEESAVAALKLQADDYLHKPISLYALATAVDRALRKRILSGRPRKGGAKRFLNVGVITLDRDRRVAIVTTGDDPSDPISAKLTRIEAKLLEHMMRRPGVSLSCQELAAALDYREVSKEEAQNLVRPHIGRLRKKIEPDYEHPRLILAARGQGYLFSQ